MLNRLMQATDRMLAGIDLAYWVNLMWHQCMAVDVSLLLSVYDRCEICIQCVWRATLHTVSIFPALISSLLFVADNLEGAVMS